MTEQEKLAELEDMMDLDEGTLHPSDILKDYDEWDSITALTFIAFMDSKFHKTITGEQIRGYKTVSDVLAVMEA